MNRNCLPVWWLGWNSGSGWLLGIQCEGKPVDLYIQGYWERGKFCKSIIYEVFQREMLRSCWCIACSESYKTQISQFWRLLKCLHWENVRWMWIWSVEIIGGESFISQEQIYQPEISAVCRTCIKDFDKTEQSDLLISISDPVLVVCVRNNLFGFCQKLLETDNWQKEV